MKYIAAPWLSNLHANALVILEMVAALMIILPVPHLRTSSTHHHLSLGAFHATRPSFQTTYTAIHTDVRGIS